MKYQKYLNQDEIELDENLILERFIKEGMDFRKLEADLKSIEDKNAKFAANAFQTGAMIFTYAVTAITALMGLYRILKYLIIQLKNSASPEEKEDIREKIDQVKRKIFSHTEKLNGTLRDVKTEKTR